MFWRVCLVVYFVLVVFSFILFLIFVVIFCVFLWLFVIIVDKNSVCNVGEIGDFCREVMFLIVVKILLDRILFFLVLRYS